MLKPDELAGGYAINERTYRWSARLFDAVRARLGVNIRLHDPEGLAEAGEVFLFNHFARFETFIPQYLLYRQNGALCRSVAAAELFRGDDAFARYLTHLGAIPHDHPHLMPLLAREVLAGRKVVIFPEGGMVKDRRVVDRRGRFSVYSRMARERRRHHTGAAVLALGLARIRHAVRSWQALGAEEPIVALAEGLGLEPDVVIAACARPTMIVPANITFHPLRIDENLLVRSAGRLGGRLSPRALEELIVESNLLLRDTDMDIRFGRRLVVEESLRAWERWLLDRLAPGGADPASWYPPAEAGARAGVARRVLRHRATRLRNRYMREMYAAVTINLSHLAATAALALARRGERRVDAGRLHRALYLAVKTLQARSAVHLHRGLLEPARYGRLARGDGAPLAPFLEAAEHAGLVALEDDHYTATDALLEETAFDEVRLSNPVAVYANEAAPVTAVAGAVGDALAAVDRTPGTRWAELGLDDWLRQWEWDRRRHDTERHAELNREETATADPRPFWLRPVPARPLGVVLVHGLLASPAEMRPLGEHLERLGHPVLAVRLPGHGTSPWDLRERHWEEWLEAVAEGVRLLALTCPRVALVGFSTGGLLALRLAADTPRPLAGVVAACPPVALRNRLMSLVPLLHGANRLARSVAVDRGVAPFRRSNSEHPHINYLHVPIAALNELGRLIDETMAHIGEVALPVRIIQSRDDPVVDPAGSRQLAEALQAPHELIEVPSDRHGIIYENAGDTWSHVTAALAEWEREPAPPARAAPGPPQPPAVEAPA